MLAVHDSMEVSMLGLENGPEIWVLVPTKHSVPKQADFLQESSLDIF